MTPREQALERALRRLLASAPRPQGREAWPPYAVDLENASGLLTGTLAPEAYLRLTEEGA